ncbi:hypothetical protein DICPUDRAFT_45798 [Dictyostelium purpureum]|uniref:Dickkopf N-terminal cysteine-rich domain-containing protein n=1 Tax=Dictyostelium purpureum TaxID=5786 RepID=F0ZC17_DICPU|nr:uncharacterized protein DICPUDRAFT_45798 [Dictyostelium purpureum]EGC38516.1 hypothetical protein DICPUDRAFT_45798 [Dictyostelium purpureum]|eukprot:XP_003284981.1 hypothetical protein DICPUDRAFT_45798 [Dictyostelium purpureum]
MKSYLLLIVAFLSVFFISSTQGEFCNVFSNCGEGNCCTSLVFGYCRPLGQLGEPCKTKTDTEHFCGCIEGLKCSNEVCVSK